MKHKRLVGCVLAAALTMSATFTGCSLVSQNSENDMNQVIAEINISRNLENDEGLNNFSSALKTVSITKRQLLSYYLNVGYSYVQNGSSYSEVFTMLVDALVNNAVVSQYSIAYLLNKMDEEDPSKTASQIITEYNALTTTTAKYEYILGEGSDYVKIANYQLLSSLNDAIDSFESSILEEEDSTAGTDTRTTPTNVDTENEDFYPKNASGELDYNVYTGYEGYLLSGSGAYEDDALDGTTRVTRRRAYTNFIARLLSNFLVTEDEDVSDIMKLSYIENEYETQLQYQVTQKYYDEYEKEQEGLLTGDTYEYVNAVYDDLLASQMDSYSDDSSAFETAIGEMSDSSFVLYTPENNEDYVDGGAVQAGGTYGFVYNILLPFSTSQSARLTELQGFYGTTVDSTTEYSVEYYNERNELLRNITTTDQRAAWFNGETDYSFDATGTTLASNYYKNGLSSSYLFFENNMLNNTRYEQLDKYLGLYPYNGKVAKNEETGSYNLLPNTLDIDDMLAEFSAYVDYALRTTSLTFEKANDYYTDLTDADLYKDAAATKKEIDYSNFIYARGSIAGLNASTTNTTARDTNQYKALSALNELQYAYTTDVGVLSNYLGYTVTLGDTTGYIKEFEYAAHQAISDGVGTVIVCAGDYGWHIMYVTYTFEVGEQFTPDWATNITKEGTFEYNFYEWIKSNDISDISSEQSSWIVQKYKTNAVTQYTERYQDLLDMDNE